MALLKKSFKVFILLLSVALAVFCGTALTGWSPWTKGLMEELPSVFPAGLKTLWNPHTLTETQKLQNLLEEVTQLRAEINSLKDLAQMALESCVKTDWALKSSGATIDPQRTSQTYNCNESYLCRILRFFWTASPPDTILQPNVHPGNCWAFKGHQGQVVIRLPARVYLTAITVQHITKDASPSGTIISAPKDFAVFGVDADREEETLLGMFSYNVEKDPMQTFPLQSLFTSQTSCEEQLGKPIVYLHLPSEDSWKDGNAESLNWGPRQIKKKTQRKKKGQGEKTNGGNDVAANVDFRGCM